MNKRRKLVAALGAGALAAPLVTLAQAPGKLWRLGYLDFGTRKSMVDAGRNVALLQGLRELGYVEGKNIVLEERYADGNAERLDGLAAELVRLKADLILTTGTPASHAAKRATAAIPIVITAITDPVGEGFAARLARPGGNITGMSTGVEDTILKLVELLMLAAPKLKRVAVITNPASRVHTPLWLQVQAAARKSGKEALQIAVRTPDEIERGFASMARERIDGVIIFLDAFLFQQRSQFAALAQKHRLPSICQFSQFPEVGGLMSYGSDLNDNFRRAGIFVNKILKGAKPGDIPFEQPTRYYLVINRKTAKSLGIEINNELLLRADREIE